MLIGKTSKLFLGAILSAGLIVGGSVTANATGVEPQGTKAELQAQQGRPTSEELQEGFGNCSPTTAPARETRS